MGSATATASLAWAFEHLDTDHVISIIRPDNVASRRVAEKLGGVVEREMDDLRGLPIVVHGYDLAAVSPRSKA